MKLAKIVWMLTLCLAVLALGTQMVAAQEDPESQVKASMKSLMDKLNALGPAKLDGEKLMFGETIINDNFDIVDQVKAEHGGTATIFMKQGPNFVRVSTNVMKETGRAIGTILDPNGPVFGIVLAGEAYYGPASILGKDYETGYEPILDADSNVIGIYYVGYMVE